ncbi:MAG: hypothetical protein ACE5FB_00750, partial [Candidatus Binatia bacterium]
GAIANVFRTMQLNRQFQKYLAENHRDHWESIYQEDLIKKSLLWPFMKGTPVDFVWKSKENFGDPKITELRRTIQMSFWGTIASWIAFGAWFLISEALIG